MSPMSEPWYEVVPASSPLTQGDLIFDCPLVGWGEVSLAGAGAEPEEASLKDVIDAFRDDVVVMTQACDLEHHKVGNVVLCPHLSLSDYRQAWQEWLRSRNQNPSEKAWKRTCEDIAAGYVWNHAFLNRIDSPEVSTEVRVVDFHDVYTAPRSFLEAILRKRNKVRLRLLPPYREHLSQAFARFFMRVGLPQPVDQVW
jgi:hypothetical protein